MREFKRRIAFRKFEKKLRRLGSIIPTYEKFQSLKPSNHYGKKIRLECTHGQIKKFLPLESLVMVDALTSINVYYVRYDHSEFIRKVQNTANSMLDTYVKMYFERDRETRYNHYYTIKESFDLLMEIFDNKCQYDNSEDCEKLIENMVKLLPKLNGTKEDVEKQINKDVLRDRLKFEVEFLDKLNGQNNNIDKIVEDLNEGFNANKGDKLENTKPLNREYFINLHHG